MSPALLIAAITAFLAAAAGSAMAQQGKGAETRGIYSCIGADGRKLTSDRPIAECNRTEQRVLNQDGSLRRIYPPSMTADERAELEQAERRQQAERLAQQDAIRRDRNLIARFPDEAAHVKAREASLDTVRLAMKASEQRMKELNAERKPLADEAEFYKGKNLPFKLRQAMDANDAAIEAQRNAIQNQESELARINRLYDAELERLKKLWAGAPAGSLGPLPTASGARLAGETRSVK